jgi:hypothetical protein
VSGEYWEPQAAPTRKVNKMNDSHRWKNEPSEKSTIHRLSYACTDNGIRLPVVDITHPLFGAPVDEEHLPGLRKESAQRAQALKEMPDSQKKLLGEKSYIYKGFFLKDPHVTYLSGMGTFMSKLSPQLIEGGKERDIDRAASQSIGPVAVRMRLRDICTMQAHALIPKLKEFPQKELCFINIAGGAASDSINTLILILKECKSLLKNRKIEIDVLDIDSSGPNFAGRCIEALKVPECHFHDLDISFNHINYNWADTTELVNLLSKRKECILMCASEGGLFEYGSDKEIIANLNALHENTPDDVQIAGDTFHDIDTVDPTTPAIAHVCGMSFRFLGVEGLKNIVEKTAWRLDSIQEKNPIYVIFTLEKDK